MKFNSCVSSKSFDDKYWLYIFEILHDDLDYDATNYKESFPSLSWTYWYYLWNLNEKTEGQFLNPTNMKIAKLHRIWEYVQTIACIYHFSDRSLENKKIISLGAGVEPCLFTFSKLGGNVIASDIYFTSNYWHPEWVKYIRNEPEIFSHYRKFKPRIDFINLNLKSKEDLRALGNFDIIYSISSLEHIYSSLTKKIKLFKRIGGHLNPGGIFSFTTDLVLKHDKTRMYKFYLRYINFKIRKVFNISPKNQFAQYINPFQSKSIKSFLYVMFNLHRYYRRYDFFTVDELKKIIDVLRKKKLYLVEDVCWKSCLEHPIKSKKFRGQWKTSISLTFRKK